MDNYVSVKLNIDENRSLAQKYGVQGIPYVFILDATGKVLYQQMSYKTKSQVITLLKKYAIIYSFGLGFCYPLFYLPFHLKSCVRCTLLINKYKLLYFILLYASN